MYSQIKKHKEKTENKERDPFKRKIMDESLNYQTWSEYLSEKLK
jgi:hypothetical protein